MCDTDQEILKSDFFYLKFSAMMFLYILCKFLVCVATEPNRIKLIFLQLNPNQIRLRSSSNSCSGLNLGSVKEIRFDSVLQVATQIQNFHSIRYGNIFYYQTFKNTFLKMLLYPKLMLNSIQSVTDHVFGIQYAKLNIICVLLTFKKIVKNKKKSSN